MIRQHWYIVMLGLLLAGMSAAAPRQFKSAGLTHWVGLSVTGVEANMLPDGGQIQVKAGCGAGAHVLYELRTGGFFFNVGVGVDYTVTNTLLATYTDAFHRLDHTGDALTYRYNYSNFAEQQSQLRLIVPIQAGYQFGDYVYVGLGASFRTLPLHNTIGTHTRMYTEGEYERFIQPFENTSLYGFYPEADYSGTGTMTTAANELAVEAEVGANIPLKFEKMRLRAGLFVGYDMPIARVRDGYLPLVNYSAVDINPLTQSQQNLSENIRFNSMYDTALASDKLSRLRIGLRVTVLLNVTPKSKHCMCWK